MRFGHVAEMTLALLCLTSFRTLTVYEPETFRISQIEDLLESTGRGVAKIVPISPQTKAEQDLETLLLSYKVVIQDLESRRQTSLVATACRHLKHFQKALSKRTKA
jgi:hypothetical protein